LDKITNKERLTQDVIKMLHIDVMMVLVELIQIIAQHYQDVLTQQNHIDVLMVTVLIRPQVVQVNKYNAQKELY